MSKVILQPAGDGDAREHFVDTIANPVPLTRIQEYVLSDVFSELKNLFKEGSVPIWGVTPGKHEVNKHKWERVQPGDIVLFSRNKVIFASASVAFTIHNKELALNLWQKNTDGETWEYLYFLDEVEYHDISYERFNKAAGYEPNYIIQGFNVLDEAKSIRVLNLLDLHSEIYFPDVTKEEYIKSVAEPDSDKPLDKVGQVKSRVEQAFLRNVLFKRKRVELCGICDTEYPVNFLVAAHIKKRADCTEEERRDYKNIIMPMCKFGCDDLYEKGYISIDNGYIISTGNRYRTKSIMIYLENIVGKRCKYWTPMTSKYFLWHKELHIK